MGLRKLLGLEQGPPGVLAHEEGPNPVAPLQESLCQCEMGIRREEVPGLLGAKARESVHRSGILLLNSARNP